MVRRPTLFTTIALVFLAASSHAGENGARAPRNLRVDFRTDPLGLDDPHPRFSWEPDDDRRGALQSAYQILVSESRDLLGRELGDSWSVKLPVRDTCQVEYEGRELVPWRTYHWIVRTWDLAGQPSPWSEPASFTMGPMRPSDWQASWISTEADSNRPKGGFVGYKSTPSAQADDFKYVQIDLGASSIFDSIVLHPARPDGDASKPGVLFPLRLKAYVDDTPYFDSKFMKAGEASFQDIENPGVEPLVIKTSRFKIRYVRIVIEKMQADGDKGFAFALGEMEVRDGANNIATQGTASALDSVESDGWSVQGLNDKVIYPGRQPPNEPKPATLLRKHFIVSNTPKRALLCASALGVFDVSINGQRISSERLAPGWTDYRSRVPYVMYDVTPYIHAGDNAIGVQLADGWYAGRLGVSSAQELEARRENYGSLRKFIAQLRVESNVGPVTNVATDETWIWSSSGVIRSADLLDGESQDWRNEQRNWDKAEFDENGWKPVAASRSGPELFARVAAPILEQAGIRAVSFKELRPRVYLYDFGQVVSGVVRVNVDLKDFATMQIRHGEALDEAGNLYVGNLRRAGQTDRLTLRPGQAGAFGPLFTLHGFRYVEISGNVPPATPDLVTAVPIASADAEAGSFECSDPMLTQLWRNIQATRRNNCVGLPTNGLTRDDRLGWLADASVFAETAMFQADVALTYAQWLGDVRLAQREDGRFRDFAPDPYTELQRAIGTPGWADAAVTLPWEHYLHYHDRRVLAASFGGVTKWIDWYREHNPTLVWKDARGEDRGDEFDATTLDHAARAKAGESVRKDLFATACFARACEVAAKSAFAVSNTKQAERLSALAAEARGAFKREFVEPDGRLKGDAQGAYALALDFDLFQGDPGAIRRAVDDLVRKIGEANGTLTTGIHTTHRALLALSRYGHHDLALKLATRREVPSWGYAIDHGATTVWERWDGWVQGRGFQDPGSNSLDSVGFGAIGEWMVRTIAGLDPEDDHLAYGPVVLEPILDGPTRTSAEGSRPFQHVHLNPRIEGLEWARLEHHSIAGRFAIAWKKAGDVLELDCTIPANTSATLALPTVDRASLREGGKGVDEVAGLQVWSVAEGAASIEVPAGTYHFTSRWK